MWQYRHSNASRALVILLLLSIFVLGGLIGCASISDDNVTFPVSSVWVRHDELSSEVDVTERDISRPGLNTGLGVGFVRPEDRELPPNERPSTYTFHTQRTEPFSTLLVLNAAAEKPYPVLVSLFVDYKQTSFTLDGRNGLLHYLELEPDLETELPLEVAVREPGWHDVFVVVFPHPEYHPTDHDKRLPPRFGVGGRRTVLCVEQCKLEQQPLPEPRVGERKDISRLRAAAFPLLPGDAPAKRRLLYTTAASPGERLQLELWARNPDDQTEEYVVLPLLDFQQIPFAGSKALALRMPPSSELFVPGHIPLPNEKGIHELQFVYIFEPYRDLNKVTDPFVQSVLRSGIIIE